MEMLIMVGVAIAALMFFSSVARRKQQRAAEELRDSLEVGVEVMTSTGFLGYVVEVTDEWIVLESEPGGARTRWLPPAIARRILPVVIDDEDGDDADLDEVPDDPAALIEKYRLDKDDDGDQR